MHNNNSATHVFGNFFFVFAAAIIKDRQMCVCLHSTKNYRSKIYFILFLVFLLQNDAFIQRSFFLSDFLCSFFFHNGRIFDSFFSISQFSRPSSIGYNDEIDLSYKIHPPPSSYRCRWLFFP